MTTSGNNPDPGSQDPPGPDSVNSGALRNGAVSEAELVTLKESHKAELRERDGKIVTLSEEVTAGRTATEAAKAATQGLEARLAELTTERDSLKGEVTSSTERVKALEDKALEVRKELMVKHHGVKADDIKNMNESQLEALESVLPTVKTTNPTPSSLDIQGPGAGVETSNLTARDKLRVGLEAADS
jgi:chromosome segregation ATPase